jgi:hypothetical protein
MMKRTRSALGSHSVTHPPQLLLSARTDQGWGANFLPQLGAHLVQRLENQFSVGHKTA